LVISQSYCDGVGVCVGVGVGELIGAIGVEDGLNVGVCVIFGNLVDDGVGDGFTRFPNNDENIDINYFSWYTTINIKD